MSGIIESKGGHSTGIIGQPFSEDEYWIGGNYADPLFSRRYFVEAGIPHEERGVIYIDPKDLMFLKEENLGVWEAQQELWKKSEILPPIVDSLPKEISILDIGAGGFANTHLLTEALEMYGIEAGIEGIELDRNIVRIVKEGKFNYWVSDHVYNKKYNELVKDHVSRAFEKISKEGAVLGEYRMRKEYRDPLNLKQGDITKKVRTARNKYDIVLLVGVIRNIEEKNRKKAMDNSLKKVKEGGYLITNDQIYQVFNEEKKIVVKYGHGRFLSDSPFGVMQKMAGGTEKHQDYLQDYKMVMDSLKQQL